MNRSYPMLVPALVLAGCMPTAKVAAPRPATPPPLLAPPPPPSIVGWQDAPVAAGSWRYARDAAGSVARFGVAGAETDFEMRCDSAARLVWLSRPGTLADTMTITTSYGARSWPIEVKEGRSAASLPARDPFLDQIAFSRARFAVDAPASPRLILPAWAEPTRVIEDCRG